MIKNWLTPTQVSAINPEQLGAQLLAFPKDTPTLEGIKVVLVGIHAPTADAIRAELYPLFAQLPAGQIADLGNAKKNSTDFLIPLFKELIGAGYLLLVLGDSHEAQSALLQSVLQLYPTAYQAFIDDRCPAPLLDLPNLPRHKRPPAKHLSIIGLQQQLLSHTLHQLFLEQEQDLLRLGQLQSTPTIEVEPHLRDADFLSVQLSSIRYADAPDQAPLSTPGLSVETACQLCRYAGTNDKLKAFGTFGIAPQAGAATAHTNALLLYYLLDGWKNRYQEFPIKAHKLTEYVVAHRDLSQPLHFMKSERSNRWWLRVAIPGKGRAYRLIPCSYQDYAQATQQQLSRRILQALEQYS